MLARSDVVDTIHLVDAAGTVAAGKALDITQAACLERFSTRVRGHQDLTCAADASVVVIADRAGTGEWTEDTGLVLLRQLQRSGTIGPVVLAGATYRLLLERGVRELGLPRTQVLGSAPEALASAARAMIALEGGCSAPDVGIHLLGVPPHHLVIPWEDVTVGGQAATKALSEPARRRVTARMAALWPPGPLTLARAASRVVAALVAQSRSTVSAFVAPDDRYGQRRRAAAVPVRLAATGFIDLDLSLNVRHQVALDNATLL